MGGNAVWALLAAGRAGGIRDIVIDLEQPKAFDELLGRFLAG